MKSRCLFLFCVISSVAALFAEESIQQRMKKFADEAYWTQPAPRPEITRAALLQALEKSRCFYLNSQKEDGSFVYSIDLETGKVSKKDNQVRQAGALWGLACLNRDRFNEPTRQAVVKGLGFFEKNITVLKSGLRCTVYPEESQISTGMVALYCLALIDFLRGQDKYLSDDAKAKYRQLLEAHLAYLRSMELEDGSWAYVYDVLGDIKEPQGSPYYDGEALLAYCKAAKYLGYTALIPRINEALPKLVKRYTADIWDNPAITDDDSKGFYQWCCMALDEYVSAGWTPHRELAADTAFAYSYWMIHKMQLATRTGNTAYAIEGIMSAYNIAKATGNEAAQKLFRETALDVMGMLMQWQFDGPFMAQNPVLSQLKLSNAQREYYLGGITSSLHDTTVRIDIQQHQTHAMLLILPLFAK